MLKIDFSHLKLKLLIKLDALKYYFKRKWNALKTIIPSYEINQIKLETQNEFHEYSNKIQNSLLLKATNKKYVAKKAFKLIILSFLTFLTYLFFKIGMRNRFYDDKNGVNRSQTEKFFRFCLFIFVGNVFYLAYFIGYYSKRDKL